MGEHSRAVTFDVLVEEQAAARALSSEASVAGRALVAQAWHGRSPRAGRSSAPQATLASAPAFN